MRQRMLLPFSCTVMMRLPEATGDVGAWLHAKPTQANVTATVPRQFDHTMGRVSFRGTINGPRGQVRAWSVFWA